MKTKICTTCKQEKLLSDFHKDNRKKSGLRSYCKTCSRIYTKTWNERNKEKYRSYMKKSYDKRRELYIDYKKELKCQKCGENHSACLVFHHKNSEEKDFDIAGSIHTKSVKRVMDEIVKCDVLCANCHRKLHYVLRGE